MKANKNIFFHYTCLISEGDYGTGKQLINCSITNKTLTSNLAKR